MGEAGAVCPICGGDGDFWRAVGDRFYQVTDFVAPVHRCRACRSLFQHPMPDRVRIAGFYPTGYWRESDGGGPLARLQRAYVAAMLRWDPMRWARRLELPSGGRFLDVGCSRGDWLALVRDSGLAARGLEADPRAAAYARERHGLEVVETDAEGWEPENAAYDAIAFFHLLEHVRDPRVFLGKCRRGLRDGGRILLRVPNPGSWQFSLTGARWKGLEMPRHLTLCQPRALRRLLDESGFEILRWSTWSLRDGPPALASSLFPAGEPTRQQILGASRPWATLAYLALVWALTPFELAAAACGKGAMITAVARKRPAL